ncbi:MAG: DNA-directed RNA polymerase subunit RpoH/Rpb5 C-terminal domain-containing protein, partial [Candidatus Thermoplasmatota archaeon]|nr:DNA-directed RNA polymerase subunit RpoH/Rpb5 C-terminal domain-containing protein [Candidatus Thermoplasmatota archaeon]
AGGREMAVKSSTKKRLMELGISETHAHRLADDANMDAIKRMTVDQVAKKLELETGDTDLENVMAVIREQMATRKRTRTGRITISRKALLDADIPTGDDRFNVLNHILVPHHELVPVDEEESALAPWGLSQEGPDGTTRLAKELLPKILITDPAVQAIKESVEVGDDELPAGWLANRVVRVVRYSRSAGSSTAFRLIVESA